MSSTRQRPVGRRSAITIFYVLALGSGVMSSFSVTFDIIAINTIIPNVLAYGFMSQWVSFVVTFCLVALLSIPRRGEKKKSIGYSLDPDFGRISILPKEPMFYIILAGFFAGISTFSYYTLTGQTDASSVLPYGQLVILYLLLGDLLAEKDTPTIVEVHSVISILFGVLLIGVTPGGFDILTLLLVLGPLNISKAILTYYQRKVKRYELAPGLRVDALNMRIWTLLFLNLTMSGFTIPFLGPSDWQIMSEAFWPSLVLMVSSSVTSFLTLVMYTRALGRGSMSIVNSLSSISVVLGIPLTLVGNFLLPGAFGELTSDIFIWIVKGFGIILVIIGVIALQATDVRALILIKVKPQTGDILPVLFDIRGVENASAIAGDYDYLICIKSRSLGKARSNILNKLNSIPEIKNHETMVVLQDFR
jgi:drug/metabolite transporter (DMT)-like permease